MLCFLVERKKIIWLGRKNIPSPLALNGLPLTILSWPGVVWCLVDFYFYPFKLNLHCTRTAILNKHFDGS